MSNKVEKKGECFDREGELICICASCYGKNLKVKVHKKRGTKYYYCKNCQKYVYKIIKIDRKGEMNEYFCGFCQREKLIRKGSSHGKRKVYFCVACQKHTVNPIVVKKLLQQVNSVFCEMCHSGNLVKRGVDVVGKQVYYCRNCQKRTVKVLNYVTTCFINKNYT